MVILSDSQQPTTPACLLINHHGCCEAIKNPFGTDKKPYTIFEVVKPVEVRSGKIAPWFGEKGGGIQYEFSNKISELLEQGILRKVEH